MSALLHCLGHFFQNMNLLNLTFPAYSALLRNNEANEAKSPLDSLQYTAQDSVVSRPVTRAATFSQSHLSQQNPSTAMTEFSSQGVLGSQFSPMEYEHGRPEGTNFEPFTDLTNRGSQHFP